LANQIVEANNTNGETSLKEANTYTRACLWSGNALPSYQKAMVTPSNISPSRTKDSVTRPNTMRLTAKKISATKPSMIKLRPKMTKLVNHF